MRVNEIRRELGQILDSSNRDAKRIRRLKADVRLDKNKGKGL